MPTSLQQLELQPSWIKMSHWKEMKWHQINSVSKHFPFRNGLGPWGHEQLIHSDGASCVYLALRCLLTWKHWLSIQKILTEHLLVARHLLGHGDPGGSQAHSLPSQSLWSSDETREVRDGTKSMCSQSRDSGGLPVRASPRKGCVDWALSTREERCRYAGQREQWRTQVRGRVGDGDSRPGELVFNAPLRNCLFEGQWDSIQWRHGRLTFWDDSRGGIENGLEKAESEGLEMSFRM